MAFQVFLSFKLLSLFKILTFLLLANTNPVLCSYKAIFAFGDSLTDTGNLRHLEGNNPSFTGRFPYGMTYFHYPTGRCSDGRLIIDFIAQALGLPLLPPYLAPGKDFRLAGANFAVGGATALEPDLDEESGVNDSPKNISMRYQIEWFKELLPLLCDTHSSCQDLLNKSLFIVGEIGGNDYYLSFLNGRSIEEVQQTMVPQVISVISSAIQTLIKHGAMMLVVPGSIPFGCSTAFLATFQSPNMEDYDPQTKCLNRFNDFTAYHNHLLQEELIRLQELHPHATIQYADNQNAALLFHRSPRKFGFFRGTLRACCGGGGPYNYNRKVPCGDSGSSVCDNPSLYASWDGQHLTEAAHKAMAYSLLEGPYAIPLLNISNLPLSLTNRAYDTSRR